ATPAAKPKNTKTAHLASSTHHKTTDKPSVTYKVKSGDSLDKIAKKNNIKLADLMKWNQLTSKSIIKPGQKLKLSQ
ncbi:MAG: LysM peptidoglycan-binding domain-containing protein, partial [Shewanella sp.]